jgi:hypothetical protein
MSFSSRLAPIFFSASAMIIVGGPRASAQNINFTCANGAVMLSGYTGNQCSGGSVPGTENNTLLAYYTPTGITVDNVAGFDYNENQGEALNANTAGVVGDPSLAIGLGCSFCNQSGTPPTGHPVETGTLTVTSSTDPWFEFDSVDLLLSGTTASYVITGYANGVQEFQLTGTGVSNPGGLYSTISGNADTINGLTIQETDTAGLSRLDNIDITVPEGGAGFMFLLLAGGACCGTILFKPRLAPSSFGNDRSPCGAR